MRAQRFLFIAVFLSGLTAFGQQNSSEMEPSPRQAYIEKWSKVAYFEMLEHGIPASITLAQGILESGNGQSDLARKSNNHFGIKCHSSWTGPKVYHDDDEKGECFRKYKNAGESFKDHSLFLVNGSRYDFLFELPRDDYKSWAKGLKSAGYATSPTYADRLIQIIEEEELHRFDREGYFSQVTSAPAVDGRKVKSAKKRYIANRVLTLPTGVPYVLLKEGENIEEVADSLNMRVAVLLKMNDLLWDSTVPAGSRVFVDFKRKKGTSKTYAVKEGETMHSIAQQQGVMLGKLYKYNHFKVGYQPRQGEVIRLRPFGLFEKRP